MQTIVAIPDSDNLEELVRVLEACGTAPLKASSVAEVKDLLATYANHLVFCDERLLEGGVHEVLHIVMFATSPTRLVVCSQLGGVDEYLRAMEMGAFDFICPPYRVAEVAAIVESAERSCRGVVDAA